MSFLRNAAVLVVLGLCAAGASGCSVEKSGSPTLPTTPSTPSVPVGPAPGLDLTLAAPPAYTVTFLPAMNGRNQVKMSWGYVDGASGYRIEAGTAPGAIDVLQADSDTNVYEWSDAPSGRVFVRVRATRQGRASAPSSEVNFVVFDFRDYIEAIFLGAGPLRPSDGNIGCFSTGVYSRYRTGTPVRVRISTSVTRDRVDAIANEVQNIAHATNGQLVATAELTNDPNPLPGQNEVTVATLPETLSLCGSFDGKDRGGCSVRTWDTRTGTLRSVRVVMVAGQTAAAYVHDTIGHGVLGMCHVDGTLTGGADMSLMGSGPNVYSVRSGSRQFGGVRISTRLSDWDLAAAQAVFSASIPPGATRAEFVARGLAR